MLFLRALIEAFLHVVDGGKLIANFAQTVLNFVQAGAELPVLARRHGSRRQFQGIAEALPRDAQRVQRIRIAEVSFRQLEKLGG